MIKMNTLKARISNRIGQKVHEVKNHFRVKEPIMKLREPPTGNSIVCAAD